MGKHVQLLNAVILVAALALLVCIGVVAVRAFDRWEADTRTSQQAGNAVREIHLLSAHLTEVQSGARGFSISGDARFLEPYDRAIADIPAAMSRLRELVTTDSDRMLVAKVLVDAVDAHIAFTRRVVGIAASGDGDGARRLVASGEGHRLLTATEAILSQIEEREVRVMEDLRSAAFRSSRNAAIAVTVGLVIAVMLIGGTGLSLHREVVRRRRVAQELEERNTDIDRFFALSLDLLCIAGMDGVFRRLNPAWEATLGFRLDELEGRRFMDFVHPDDVEATTRAMSELSGDQRVLNFVNRYRCKDGTYRFIEWRSQPWQGHRIYAAARDVTGRIEEEERLLVDRDSLECRVRERTAELERRVSQIESLRRIDMAITGSLDLRVTLDVFLGQLVEQLRCDAACVSLLDPHSLRLELAAHAGNRAATWHPQSLRLGEGHAGTAAAERRVVFVPDLRSDPGEFADLPGFAEMGIGAYHAIPLIAKGHVNGVVEVLYRANAVEDPDRMSFLEALASQAAIAIDNATLFSDLVQSNNSLIIAYETTLEGWSRALDLRDKETEGHSARVTQMTTELARALGVPQEDMPHVRRGALLHDIGKLGVPDSILLKPGPLTDEEWVIMKRHPILALELLSPIAFLRLAIDIPYGHHEKWDGSGYPRGLKGEQIPLAARIFAPIDVWDALVHERPYRAAMPKEKALEIIRKGVGTHFDPRVAEAFLRMVG